MKQITKPCQQVYMPPRNSKIQEQADKNKTIPMHSGTTQLSWSSEGTRKTGSSGCQVGVKKWCMPGWMSQESTLYTWLPAQHKLSLPSHDRHNNADIHTWLMYTEKKKIHADDTKSENINNHLSLTLLHKELQMI